MIKIYNEDVYYNLPSYQVGTGQQHTPANMVFKAMTYHGNDVYAYQLCETLRDLFGINITPLRAGKGLATLYGAGYVARKRVKGIFLYTKTDLYHNSVMSQT